MLRVLRNQLTSSWRVYLVIAALLLAWCALVARLFYVHFLDAEHGSDFLKQRGDSRVMRVQPIAASRGEIYDRILMLLHPFPGFLPSFQDKLSKMFARTSRPAHSHGLCPALLAGGERDRNASFSQ